MKKANNQFMQLAIESAIEGINAGHGGPFGTCIVKDGEVIAVGHNHVLAENDPSAHGEIWTIRQACKKLGTFDLSGCELYTTGEPCTMCMCACMWANIEQVYYGCTIEDNALIGFRDEAFDNAFGGREGALAICPCEELDREACLSLFEYYNTLNAQNY